jgi:acyl-CoA synthetase (AMP-forming)/AMP-acid ligase II
VMPLFHIHGLAAALLASLYAGGSVVCTGGLLVTHFFEWLEQTEASWYTAVPTMHQGILARARSHLTSPPRHRLRLARSSSAPLAPMVMQEIEELFGVPVIEAYGMTEAAHQMASNPSPPRARKPGSVGLAAGPQVAILDERGTLLPEGETGEVAIRGESVTAGYEANPEANRTAFTDGWFRTGDQGTLDQDGYLRLTGRLKEIINRGGEKVSPLEVDAVLMDHPAVAQVVTFGMPHAKLGEEVAAAVVLREGESLDEHALRDFAGTRLAPFKVPRKIVFLTEIPKGATGKLQRIGLAEKLGLSA